MARKRAKRKTVKRKVKRKPSYSKNLAKIIGILIGLIIVVSILYIFNESETETGITTPVVPEVIQTGGSCTKNSECFLAGCKSNTALECINTAAMDNYYKKCKGWWDVRVEAQDFSACACVQNSCGTP